MVCRVWTSKEAAIHQLIKIAEWFIRKTAYCIQSRHMTHQLLSSVSNGSSSPSVHHEGVQLAIACQLRQQAGGM